MLKKKLEKYRKLLEERRTVLTQKAQTTAIEGREVTPEGGEDYVDDAVTSYTREFLMSLSDLERRQLIEVEEALVRIKEGTYGVCQMCGDDIDEKRLEAIPWAKYTRDCQETLEKEELAERDKGREIGEEE